MEKLGIGLDDDSASIDQKQTNPQESRLLSIQRCIKYLTHACLCTDANCRQTGCQRVKKIIQHSKSCKQKKEGGCPICKQLVEVCCYHAKHCQVEEAKCPLPFCVMIKTKLRHQELQQTLQQALILKRDLATTFQNGGMSCPDVQTSPGNSNSSNQPSPGAQPDSSPQPGIGMTPATGPPVGALQAAQQVQAAAARQTAPHMVAASVNYGKGMLQMMSGVLNMSNVSCLLGRLRMCSESQPHKNPQPQPAPQMGLQQQTQLVGGPGNMPNSIGNSSMGPPQVIPNPGPPLGGMQRTTQERQQYKKNM